MKISKLKINPNNPQKFDDLSKLEKSISEFPKMMELRPMVYDSTTMYVLGGNKRLICLQNLGYDDIPDNWAISADNLTENEKKRFILSDNIGFGEWDNEILISEFGEFNFDELGLDIDYGQSEDELTNNDNNEDIDYDFPIAKELSFSDNYIIVTFKNDRQYDEFIAKNNIHLEKSANYKSEKLIEFDNKTVFTYEDLHTII